MAATFKIPARLAGLMVFTWAMPLFARTQNTFSPAGESLRLFNAYKPIIEKHNNAVVDDPVVLVGDINSDGKEDCIISFVMTSRDGGNAMIGRESAIYLNTGAGMKVAGAFPKFDFCYSPNQIKDQVIYATEYKCNPPYDQAIGQRKFIYSHAGIKILR